MCVCVDKYEIPSLGRSVIHNPHSARCGRRLYSHILWFCVSRFCANIIRKARQKVQHFCCAHRKSQVYLCIRCAERRSEKTAPKLEIACILYSLDEFPIRECSKCYVFEMFDVKLNEYMACNKTLMAALTANEKLHIFNVRRQLSRIPFHSDIFHKIDEPSPFASIKLFYFPIRWKLLGIQSIAEFWTFEKCIIPPKLWIVRNRIKFRAENLIRHRQPVASELRV